MDWDPQIEDRFNAAFPAMPAAQPDPLAEWSQNLTPEELQYLKDGNAQEAIDRLVARGVPPPPSQITSFAPIAPVGLPSVMQGQDSGTLPVFKDGKLQGNLTSDQGTPPTEAPQDVPLPQADPRKAAPTPSFDPEPDGPDETPSGSEIPLPKPRPTEAGPGASDISAQSKTGKVADGLGGFAQSLAGVKAPIAPPLNAVGTPAAPHPSAVQAPNVASLLQLIGQQSQPNALQTLGRLLVAGKA